MFGKSRKNVAINFLVEARDHLHSEPLSDSLRLQVEMFQEMLDQEEIECAFMYLSGVGVELSCDSKWLGSSVDFWTALRSVANFLGNEDDIKLCEQGINDEIFPIV